jgi:hypothetical protein
VFFRVLLVGFCLFRPGAARAPLGEKDIRKCYKIVAGRYFLKDYPIIIT